WRGGAGRPLSGGAGPGRGPRPEVARFEPLLDETLRTVRPARVVADAGYDSEGNHRYARKTCGVRSFMPATHGRPSAKPPAGRYRRQMRRRLNKRYGGYGQRWQAGAGQSMGKRRLGSAGARHTHHSQRRDLWLLALTHNLMIDYQR